MDQVLCYDINEVMSIKSNPAITLLIASYVVSTFDINLNETNVLALDNEYDELISYIDHISSTEIKVLVSGYYKIDMCAYTELSSSNVEWHLMKNNISQRKCSTAPQMANTCMTNILHCNVNDILTFETIRVGSDGSSKIIEDSYICISRIAH